MLKINPKIGLVYITSSQSPFVRKKSKDMSIMRALVEGGIL